VLIYTFSYIATDSDYSNADDIKYKNTDIPDIPYNRFTDENSPFVLPDDYIIPEERPKSYKSAMDSLNK
jgi:hypothetical protein